MNFRTFHFFALAVLLAAVPSLLHAAEIYMWVDEKGVRHVTDQPPETQAQVIGKDHAREESEEEIRQFRQEQRAYERDLEQRRRYNEAAREREKLREEYKESVKNSAKRYEDGKEKERESDARYKEYIRARTRAYDNKDYHEVRRLSNKYYEEK